MRTHASLEVILAVVMVVGAVRSSLAGARNRPVTATTAPRAASDDAYWMPDLH